MSGPSHVKNRLQGDHWTIEGTLDWNGRADGATITLAAPVGNDRDITVQLTKAGSGDPVESVQMVELHLVSDAAASAWAATGGTTGLTDQGAGAIQALVAKKVFKALSDATGLLELRWTDTASEVAHLAVVLPSGKVTVSSALTI